MNLLYKIFRTSFFIFLDISGILLGVFLMLLGLAMVSGLQVVGWVSWIVLVLGVGAFLLHIGHYFNLKYMRWTFGDDYFIQKKSDRLNP